MPHFTLPHLPRSDSLAHIAQQVRDALVHHKHEKESEAHQVIYNQ
jgi:hypothetical protein